MLDGWNCLCLCSFFVIAKWWKWMKWSEWCAVVSDPVIDGRTHANRRINNTLTILKFMIYLKTYPYLILLLRCVFHSLQIRLGDSYCDCASYWTHRRRDGAVGYEGILRHRVGHFRYGLVQSDAKVTSLLMTVNASCFHLQFNFPQTD